MDATESESTKDAFYTALKKAEEELDQNPSYKCITSASISTKIKDNGSRDSILGHNNSDKIKQMEMVFEKQYEDHQLHIQDKTNTS